MKQQKTIIVVVGMPGSGKGEVSNFIKEQGIPMFRTGDVIRKAVIDSGQALTPENSEAMARRLREQHGMDYPARTVSEKIKKLEESLICVEGPRDMFELKRLSDAGRLVLFVVDAPFEVRFRRSSVRQGSRLEPTTRDTKDVEKFRWRDQKELERGQGEVINTTKYEKHVINNSGSVEGLKKKVRALLGEVKSGMK